MSVTLQYCSSRVFVVVLVFFSTPSQAQEAGVTPSGIIIHTEPQIRADTFDFNWTSSDLRFEPMEKCVYIGPRPFSGLPTTLEWNITDSLFQGRLTALAVRSGIAGHEGFVGVALRGDGAADPVGSPNMLMGWPERDRVCTAQLYMNSSTDFMGYCEYDQETLSLPNCTYAEQIGYNGTCKTENDTIPYTCYCYRDGTHGYWGPEPTCLNCTDGCNGCYANFGGYDCRVPIQIDVYPPDEANVYIRLTWRRNLDTYPHTISAGSQSEMELFWAYRMAAMFNTDDEKCADGVKSNLWANSPYTMVTQETERMGLRIDWHSNAYAKTIDSTADEGYTCVDATLHDIGYPPVRHFYHDHAASIIGTEYMETMMHLGLSYDDRIQLTPNFGIDDIHLSPEGDITPVTGDSISIPGGSVDPLVWTEVSSANGSFSTITNQPYIQYLAVAVFAGTNQTTKLIYTNSEMLKVWMDGGLIVVDRDGAVDEQSTNFVITPGWHQFVFKVYDSTAPNEFKFKFTTGALLSWRFYVNSPQEGQAIGSEWVEHVLHLGSLTDYIDASSATIDTYFLKTDTEGQQLPSQGDTVAHPLATTNPLTWRELSTSNGQWVDGSYNYMIQYLSFAIWSPEDQFVESYFRHDEEIRGWLDGSLIVTYDVWDDNKERYINFTLSQGWHQFLWKIHDNIGTSYFRIRFVQGGNLKYYREVPLRCNPNPCHNGGTCTQYECQCTSTSTGTYCENTYLWGELHQNMRTMLFFME